MTFIPTPAFGFGRRITVFGNSIVVVFGPSPRYNTSRFRQYKKKVFWAFWDHIHSSYGFLYPFPSYGTIGVKWTVPHRGGGIHV